ncbi:MAG: extracellular solute-binding protein [Bacilli bacterium]
MVKKILGQTYIWIILLLMYLPILVLIAFSFTEATNVGEWTGFTFNLYTRLFQSKEIMTALGNTLIIALLSAIISVLLGTSGAIGAFYSKKHTKNTIDTVTQIPVVNAEIVMALSLTVMFVFLGSVVFKQNLFGFWTLLIGHVVLSVPFVYISVKPKLQQMDPSLYEAAIDLGATPHKALWKVIIPEIIPGIVSGFLLAITLSLDDFIITAFTRGSGLLNGEGTIETLSTLVQAKIKKGPIPPEMRALTTFIFLAVLIVVIVISIRKYQQEKKLHDPKNKEKVKKVKYFGIFLFLGACCLTSCSPTNSSSSQTLRLLNWEDYIYEQDISNGYEKEDLIDQFVSYVKENYPQYQNVKVIYDTTDTNETMFNELQTGKSKYDLICPSDYMIQKLVSNKMLEKLDRNLIPNYEQYASSQLKTTLDQISAPILDKDGNKTGEYELLEDYAVGYMWGTLGLLFNPSFSKLKVEEEQMFEDVRSWSILWDSTYKGMMSIKDSMRDTYAAALMYTYDDELTELRNRYLNNEITSTEYNASLSTIFNRCEDENIKEVNESLNELKKNIFGMEVDSGKEDIVTRKIGINLAWSGDAVYSIAQAHDDTLVSETFDLYYSLPENGGNIWFDGWVMPKLGEGERSQEQYELAHIFLDFISNPENASQNMDYIGYTPFIAGDSIIDLVRDWYDYRCDVIYLRDEEEEEYYEDVVYIDPVSGDELSVDYNDVHFIEDSDPLYDDVELIGIYLDENEEEVRETLDETFNERLILPDDIEEVDLSYFFNGTLDEYEDGVDTIFYSDCYHSIFNEDGTRNICVGQEFFTQYPDEECIIRCAVMEDYGKQNGAILKMWENFKSDPLPVWAIILFSSEIVILFGGVLYFYIRKRVKVNLRTNRKN